ncbi:hypothetical protein [Polyangium aurulentum]|uniref:hypothetical protein n=1 Tax=Polyangium aurulentum TaxID=2567896 RepID=UPI0010AE20AF|nr:hypothetical protein [Polyangium aurulentum]UQA57307.1 hypothetical protein E8A73_039420 [Polyangium aurulentum]
MTAPPIRPAAFAAMLLRALEASDGRRKKRKRNTAPDSLGMAMKRALLEGATTSDPDPDEFEGFLLERALPEGGGALAMAREIFEEWRLAAASPELRAWLEEGAPSDDAQGEGGGADRR